MSSFKVDRVLPAASWCAKDSSVNKRLSESLRKLKSTKRVKNSPTLLNGFDMSVTEQACLGILTGLGAQVSADGSLPEAVPVAKANDRVVDAADAGQLQALPRVQVRLPGPGAVTCRSVWPAKPQLFIHSGRCPRVQRDLTR